MEVYILDSQELTLEQLQALADEAGVGLEDFKHFKGVTVKKKDVAGPDATVTSKKPASLESKLENTRSKWKKYQSTQFINKDGKYDPHLILDPNHKIPDGGQNYINARNKFTIEERELTKAITTRNLDPEQLKTLTLDQAIENPERILSQKEDVIVDWLRKEVPWYNIQAGKGDGNSVMIPDLGDGINSTYRNKEIDLTEFLDPSKRRKEQTIQILKELSNAKKLKTDNEIISISVSNLGKSMEESPKNINSVNALLKDSTPYELEQLIGNTGIADTAANKKYNVLKDGELVTTLSAYDLDDFFKNNITKDEFEKMQGKSFQALSTMAAIKDAKNHEDFVEIKNDPKTRLDYFENNFQGDLIKKIEATGSFSQSDILIIKDYLSQQKQNTTSKFSQGSMWGLFMKNKDLDQLATNYSTLEGLDDNLKERLINANINNETLKDLASTGINDLIFNKINQGQTTLLGDFLSETKPEELLRLANDYNDPKKIIKILQTKALKEGKTIEQYLGGNVFKHADFKLDEDVLEMLGSGNIEETFELAGGIKNTWDFIGERLQEEDQKAEVEHINTFYEPHQKEIIETIQTIAEEVKSLGPEYTISPVSTKGGPLLSIVGTEKNPSAEKEALIEILSGKLATAQSTFHNLTRDREVAIDKLITNSEAFYASLADRKKYDYIIDAANKEYGLGNLILKDVNDAFATIALTVPTLFDSEWAIGKQKQLNDKNNYYKEMTGPEFSLEYITRTLGQQSANITLAIATAGGGSALGLTEAAVANAIGIGFGTTAGTQTFRDLNIQVDAYDEALKQKELYTKAYNAQPPGISEYNYTMAMRDINKTLAMGRLNDNEILNASFSNGIIEGVFTKYLGTAPNSIKLIKDFSTVNRKLIAEQLFKNNYSKVTNLIGKPLAIRTGSEVFEELSIFGGQQFITEAGILGRDIDAGEFKSGANETFWATVVTAGLSQGTGIAYSGLTALSITKEYEKKLSKKRFNINGLSKTLQSKTFKKLSPEVQQALLYDIGKEMKEMGLAVDQNALDFLNLGATEINRLIGTQMIKRDFLISEDINPFLSKDQTDDAIAAKKKTMTAQQVKDFDGVLNSLDIQIKNIKEAATKNNNYTTAKNALGNLYKSYNVALKNDIEYNKKSAKDKLVYIINKARNDFEQDAINKAKSNPRIVEWVDGARVDKNGDITKDKRFKKLTNAQKENLYRNFGKKQALGASRGFGTQLSINRSAKQILGDVKNVKVKEWTNDDKGIKLLQDTMGKDKVGTPEYADALNKLQNNKTFGLVFGKTILTQNKAGMDADLANGELRAGTVILHEFTHITDDARMKSPAARAKYFNNLFKAASNSTNKALKRIHNEVVKDLNGIYGILNSGNRDIWEDEYSNYLQERLYAYEDEVQIEKDDSFLTRVFNASDPSNLNTPEKALNYLAANNAAFRSGKLSKESIKAIDEYKGKDLKKSDKNINELAIEYKTDPSAMSGETFESFYQQYNNTALAAMGFNVAKGDIATEQAEGFAVDAFPRVTRTYDPKKINPKTKKPYSFTGWINATVGMEGSARIGQELERKKGLVRQSQAQEQTRLVAKETAEDIVNLKERKKKEELEDRAKSLIKTTELRGVKNKLTEVDEAIGNIDQLKFVNLLDSRSGELDFAKINEEYGSEVAGALYGLNPKDAINLAKKLKKGSDLTYSQNKIDKGSKLISEAERIQSDYTSIQDAKEMISLFPEYNISTPTAVTTEQGQETKTSGLVQGRSLGTSPSVLKFFYEDYIDPKALSKDFKTRQQAITTPKGKSKGTTSQPQVKRLKPEFNFRAGAITNAAVAKAQKKLGITKQGTFNIPPKGEARTEFGRLLIGLANLKGAIVANTAVDTKVKKGIKDGTIKTAKSPLQIETDLKAGRSKVQYSLKTGKATVDAMFDFARNKEAAKLFGPLFLKFFSTSINADAGNRGVIYNPITGKEEASKGAFNTGRSFITSLDKLIRDYGPKGVIEVSPATVAATESLIEAGELGILGDVKKIARQTLSEVTTDVNPDDIKAMEMAMKPQNYPKYKKSNKKNLQTLRKGKKLLLKKFKELYDSNNDLLPTIKYLTYAVNSNYHPFRNLAIVEGGVERGYEEHMLQFKPFVDTFIAAIQSTKTDFDGFIKWANKNYFQEAITKKSLSGPAHGMAQSILDQPSRYYNRFNNETITPWSSQYQMHPMMQKQVNEALEGKREWKDVVSVDIRKYNEYNSIYGLINPNVQSRFDITDAETYNVVDITDAERYNVVVPPQFRFNSTIIAVQNEAIYEYLLGNISKAEALIKVQLKVNETFKPDASVTIAKDNKADKAMSDARNSVEYKESRKGISVFDFDDTLAQSSSKVLYTMPDGTTGSLTAGEFAIKASDLTKTGAEFDFSEFNEVKEGRKGPLADLALKRQGKFGSKDIFVLTARPQASAINIKKFLDEIGLNIPLANITGLENGTPEAKADWMVDKYADGYNDFYFADDAFKNIEAVKNVFDVLDVKSKVQQARVKFSDKLDKDFNDMIERNMNVKSETTYSDVLARRKGRNQKRFAYFIPPSADDFRGLTMYTFAGKGKQGELDQDFFDKALIKPYMAGINAMQLAKNRIKNAYKILQKGSPEVRKKLRKKIGGTRYTHDEAIRIYLWNKDGVNIPGLSKTDRNKIVSLVSADTNLVAFAEGVKLITKKDTYITPNEYWDGTTIVGDLGRLSREVNRKEYLKEFTDNADILFSPKNLNKIEAIYGFRVREAIEDSLYRMKTGSNKAQGSNRIVNAWNTWVNNSVGAIMFFNRRSALLQMLSAGNFVNWSDNNPLKAGLAFANAPRYWSDVVYLFNSPKLKARRAGLEGDINESEIAEAARKGGMQGALSYLLKLGFTPTQIADSIAIATGGAAFYRNRINTYKKEGFTTEEAEAKAFADFSAISDETQQSADPMLISSQQAGVLGRLVLAFQNTPMQYTRLMKKAGQDLINNRGDAKTNISKILYYGFIQNLIFSSLQSALFALVPGFDDEEEPDFKTDKAREAWLAKQEKREGTKVRQIANSMMDTILRGSGLAGAVVATIKNVILEYNDRQDMSVLQKSRAKADLIIALASISPPISSKMRKVSNALDVEDFSKDVIAERGYSIMIDDKFQLSPAYDVVGNLASGLLNVPLDRVFNEVNSITEALDERNTAYQRLALGLGWKTWNVNAKIEEHDLIVTNAKSKRKVAGIEKGKQTRKDNKEILKDHKRLRAKVLNALPMLMRDSIRRKEKEDNKLTAIYKLNRLAEKYIE